MAVEPIENIESGSLVGYGRDGADWGPDREHFLTLVKSYPVN
jgi:hypothetical protein